MNMNDLNKMFLSEQERISIDVRVAFPHKPQMEFIPGHGFKLIFRPISKRIVKLGRCWWRKTEFSRLYYGS